MRRIEVMRAPNCTCPFSSPGAHYAQCAFWQWLESNPTEMKAWETRFAKAEEHRLKHRTPEQAWQDYLSANDMGPYGGR